jgi:hypothetical protein
VIATRPYTVTKIVLGIPNASELHRPHRRPDVALLKFVKDYILANRGGRIMRIERIAVGAQQGHGVVERLRSRHTNGERNPRGA